MFCTKCGRPITPGAMFCESCGAKAPSVPAPSGPTAPGTASSAPYGSGYSAPSYAPTPAPAPAPAPTPYYGAPAYGGAVVKAASKAWLGWLIGGLVVALAVAFSYLYFFTNFFKSDEELIRARIDTFVTSYNNGDMDAVMECFSQKTRSQTKSAIGIGESIAGGLTGFDFNYSDLFGLASAFSGGNLMQIDDIQFTVNDGDTKVTVTATLTTNVSIAGQTNSNAETVHFEMVKEEDGFLNENWYINNLY